MVGIADGANNFQLIEYNSSKMKGLPFNGSYSLLQNNMMQALLITLPFFSSYQYKGLLFV